MGSAFSQQQYVVAKPPTGRLTLVTGEPVMSSEQANKQNVYYTPYTGSMLPIYDGTGWRERTFSELTLALAGSANWATDSNFDLFVYDDQGTLRLLTGPAWTNDTTRATALERVNGLLMNAASMTGRYGASSTVTVAQDRGLYVGTMRTNASGQTTWELGGTAAGGDPGKLFLWNCYNRVLHSATVVDSTDSWTYGSSTIRKKNDSDSNRVTYVVGLAEDSILSENTSYAVNSAGGGFGAGIGVDSTSAFSGNTGNFSGVASNVDSLDALYRGTPGIGLHFLQAIETGNATGTQTFYGDAGAPTLVVKGLLFTGRF